jgi:hypothetical protein
MIIMNVGNFHGIICVIRSMYGINATWLVFVYFIKGHEDYKFIQRVLNAYSIYELLTGREVGGCSAARNRSNGR